MQQKKKTALRTRAHRKVSSASQASGLIVTANTAKRSAGTARAIDNRSHRTPQVELRGPDGLTIERLDRDPYGRHHFEDTAPRLLQRTLERTQSDLRTVPSENCPEG